MAIAVAASVLVAATPAAPATAAGFDAGYIISDANFYNGNAMSEAEIQAFLNSTVTTCENTNCLDVYKTNTPTRTWSFGTCNTYQGGTGESAARIIYKVQRACGISAKVLLVTLQKEQGLLTRTSPSDGILRKAMGYGCPDTSACDSYYYGFFNQVYAAARQLTWYNNTGGSFTYIKVGQSNPIRYHPNAACGSSGVTIQNKATAALYYYTPYQPNAAALANMYGTGDTCSAYGNRNFSVHYNRYFGSPTASASPVGAFESLTATPGKLQIRGWAFDSDTKNPINVHAYVDGRFAGGWAANKSRGDVQAVYPSQGPSHGFLQTLSVSAGAHKVCVYGLNDGAGSNTTIGCRSVTVPAVVVPSAVPQGWLDSVTGSATGVTVRGWALDPTTSAPTDVHVYVDGAFAAGFPAKVSRGDVANAFPTLGANHGFSQTLTLRPGNHSVCVYALNAKRTQSTSLGCKTASVVTPVPKGNLETFNATPSSVEIVGWAFDPTTTRSTDVHVYVDGAFATGFPANATRGDVKVVYPAQGTNHGFNRTIELSSGRHTVCVYALNATRARSTSLGCRIAAVSTPGPTGNVEGMSGTDGGVAVRGWAFDPTTPSSTDVHVYVDGRFNSGFPANQSRGDVAAAFPAQGANHGFNATIATTPGSHQVCVYALNASRDRSAVLRCAVVVAG